MTNLEEGKVIVDHDLAAFGWNKYVPLASGIIYWSLHTPTTWPRLWRPSPRYYAVDTHGSCTVFVCGMFWDDLVLDGVLVYRQTALLHAT